MALLKTRCLALLLAGFAAAGCATNPMDTSMVTSGVTPSQAVESEAEVKGETIQWGGQIVSILHDEQSTRVEVLSYPLARGGYPNTRRKPTGRFVLRRDGFLEPQDYAPGRLVTVVGTMDALVTTSVQDTDFLVPIVDADRLRLWDLGYGDPGRGRPRFGVGVGISIGL